MSKRIIFSMFLLLGVSAFEVNAQVEKKKVYTLKDGETLLMPESSLGVNPTSDGLLVTISKGENENYIISPTGKKYGPFNGPLVESRNMMSISGGALYALIAGKEKGQDYEYTLIMNDGKEFGPYKDIPYIGFDENDADWAIEEHLSEPKGDDMMKYTSYITFKNGKKMTIDGNAQVYFNPNGEGWYLNNLTNDEKTEFILSDGKKLGPYMSIFNPVFTSTGQLNFAYFNEGKYGLMINGKETPVNSANLYAYTTNSDGSDWVIENTDEENTVHSFTFKNGKTTENYDMVLSGATYDNVNKRWFWAAQKGKEIWVFYNDGTKIGPYPFSAEYPGGSLYANTDGSQWCLTYNETDNKIINIYNVKGTTETRKFELPEGSNTSSIAFYTPDNRLYFLKTTYTDEGADHTSEIQMTDNNQVIDLGKLGDEVFFSQSGKIRWSLSYDTNGMLLDNDGKKETFENVFSLRYDKKAGKLYWLTLVGKDIYMNTLNNVK